MKISEIITDKYKLRIPPTVYYELLADVQEYEKDQEQKTGYWIDDEFGSKCSCCGIYTHLDKFDRPMKFRCCSMCGAKMAEPQERNDREC